MSTIIDASKLSEKQFGFVGGQDGNNILVELKELGYTLKLPCDYGIALAEMIISQILQIDPEIDVMTKEEYLHENEVLVVEEDAYERGYKAGLESGRKV